MHSQQLMPLIEKVASSASGAQAATEGRCGQGLRMQHMVSVDPRGKDLVGPRSRDNVVTRTTGLRTCTTQAEWGKKSEA